MLGRLGRDAGSLLGVEIASDSIRMVHLRRQRGCHELSSWVHHRPGPWSGDAALGDNPERLLDALLQAHRACAPGQRRAAVALPASQVICKTCRLPMGMDDEDAEAHLLDQAEQLFPFPLDDLALDFQVMGRCEDESGTVDVLVAACRQSQLDPLEHVFTQAGLELAAIEVDSFALQRALTPRPHRAVAFLQLEAGELVLHRWQRALLPQRQQLPLAPSGCWVEGVERLWQLAGGEPGIEEVLLTGAGADTDKAAQVHDRLGIACSLAVPSLLAGRPDVPAAPLSLAYGLALGAWQ